MSKPLHPSLFRFPAELTAGFRDKNVLITGAGRHGGLGQAFAFSAGLNGASSVGVHFHRSYSDGLETVETIREAGGNAYPIQADVTSPGDIWATRAHVIRQLDGALPDVIVCNSGLSEGGYMFGRAPRPRDDESPAMRRARARQDFVDNLSQSRAVIDTKLFGFLATSHLWTGEAAHAGKPLQLVFISSRQAFDPGAAVPGYVAANWGVLSLPNILRVNLGKSASLVNAYSVAFPFIRTSMTEEYKDNPRVFGRWQPRMLEPHEAAAEFARLLSQPAERTNGRIFQLDVTAKEEGDDEAVDIVWSEVALDPKLQPLGS